MSKYRQYKNGIYGIRYNGYYIVPEGEGRKKAGFHVVDSNKELKFDSQSSIEDCKWLINIEQANAAEKALIRKLYSMEIIDLTILFSQLLERGDDLNEKEQMLNKWLEMVRDRKARGIDCPAPRQSQNAY